MSLVTSNMSGETLEDEKFNKYFVKDPKGSVSFYMISNRLNLSKRATKNFINDRGFTTEKRDDDDYLLGYTFREEAFTPSVNGDIKNKENKQNKERFKENDLFKKIFELHENKEKTHENKEKTQKTQEENIELRRLKVELEEYKRHLKQKNDELDAHKELNRQHIREKLEAEELHRKQLRELTETINLCKGVNIEIGDTFKSLKPKLERASGRDVKMLILIDFIENNNRHSRVVYVPEEQTYTFEIGDEHRHHNPDLSTHFT